MRLIFLNPSSCCTLAIRQDDQAVDQAGEGRVNRVDLAQFRFEQPPGNPATQPVDQPAWCLRLDFPQGVQRCELFRQVRVALRNIGQ